MKSLIAAALFSLGFFFAPPHCQGELYEPCCYWQNQPKCCGTLRTITWMPETPPLFKPMMANPRQVVYSVGWRYNDKTFAEHIVDVSYADWFAFFRICNLIFPGDAFQFDLEGGLWAIFDHLNYSAPLINADYFVGGLFTYAYDCWSFRSRFYHISSHIGDEFLLNNPDFDRVNPSAEYLEFTLAYKLNPYIRIYGGYTLVVQRDASFPFKRNRFEAGLESYFNFAWIKNYCHCLIGRPFFAMHFRFFEDYNYEEDVTYVLGYEFSKTRGLCRRLRIFLEYHKGYSVEGQFSMQKTDYISLRATYGF